MRAQPGRLRPRASPATRSCSAAWRASPRRRRWAGSRARPRRSAATASSRYAAKTWDVERRVIARVEASDRGADSRFVVTNLAGTPRWLYEAVYCARGQAENLVKAHKLHLASDRTSCSKATANQFRLVLHTAAYWLLHTLRGLAPKRSFWREAQFDTLRLALIKVAAPGHRAGDPDQARAAVQLSLPRQPRAARVPGPRGRPEPRGGVPRPSPSPQPPAPIIAPPAPRTSDARRPSYIDRVRQPGE